MDCRFGCGACCVAPSINSFIPGMPKGKPAGVICIQLDEDNLCKLFGLPERPDLCDQFKAHYSVCGDNRDQALHLISVLEVSTQP